MTAEMWAGFHAPDGVDESVERHIAALMADCGSIAGVRLRTTVSTSVTRGRLIAPATHLLHVVFADDRSVDDYIRHPAVADFNAALGRLDVERMAVLARFAE